MKFAIVVDNLNVYFDRFPVLEDVSFQVSFGDFISIVGPNGGGKTTLIKSLLGLVDPVAGSINILGYKPKEIPFEYVGYVPQLKLIDRTFPALVIELVATGVFGSWKFRLNKYVQTKCLEALEQVGIPYLAFRPISKLSGGELQRVYLARAFVRKPQILLLDEPATGIDTISESDFSQLLEQYQKTNKSAILFVTHDWEYAYHHSTKVLLLNRKVIAFLDPIKAFTDECLRKTFGHIGHTHSMEFVVRKDA
ncbi:MAG: metal ABC transporter ATP-binding protein [Candidatus Kapaibacteriales bacterium]